MKSFACEVVTPTLLDMCATTTSSAPELYFATFGISLQVLCRFAWHYSSGSPVPLQSPSRVLAVFMPCGAYPVVRFPVHSVSQGRCPLDFTTVKVIFDTSMTVYLRSTPLSSPYVSSSYLPDGRQATDRIRFDLVAQYHRMNDSTTRRFGKYA